MLCLMKLNLQFLIVSHDDTEHIVRPRGVGGGFMHLSVKMGRHGRYVLILEFDLVFDSGLNEVVYSLFTLFPCFTYFTDGCRLRSYHTSITVPAQAKSKGIVWLPITGSRTEL